MRLQQTAEALANEVVILREHKADRHKHRIGRRRPRLQRAAFWTSAGEAAMMTVVADELVLIVDDNAKNAKLAGDVLRFAGFRTLEAGSGGAAIALALEHRPDVILMDIRLP